eukprot:8667535-Karenia_brevis.AAC.1
MAGAQSGPWGNFIPSTRNCPGAVAQILTFCSADTCQLIGGAAVEYSLFYVCQALVGLKTTYCIGRTNFGRLLLGV